MMSELGFEKLNKMLRDYRRSSILFTAHKLGIFDKISQESIECNRLSKILKISEKGLQRLLSALCATGITIKENNLYSLSREYKPFLNPKSEDYIGGMIDHEIHLHKRWNRLSDSVTSGQPVKNTKEQTKPEDTQRFIKAMNAIGQRSVPLLLKKIKFHGNEKVLDLGGGPGKYVKGFCDKYPEMQITLFDQSDTIKVAKSNLSNHNCYRNVRFLSGNFLEDDLGEKYDVIFCSNVIHIFGPEDVHIIFDKCYKAMNPDGRLLIKDHFLNDNHTGPEFVTLFSLHMLLSTEGGKCYSESEIISLAEKAKFSHVQSTKLTESSMVIESVKY